MVKWASFFALKFSGRRTSGPMGFLFLNWVIHAFPGGIPAQDWIYPFETSGEQDLRRTGA